MELKVRAATCNFSTLHDSLIKDKIVCGITDSTVRKWLLREANLTVESCKHFCKSYELYEDRVKTIEESQILERKQAHFHTSYRRNASTVLQYTGGAETVVLHMNMNVPYATN